MSNMMIFLFILQIIISILLILIVLLQSSDEDALSGIGASAGNSSILSHSGSVDLITKFTIFLGVCLIFNSLFLAIVSKKNYIKNNNIMKEYLQQNKDLTKENEELKETINKGSELTPETIEETKVEETKVEETKVEEVKTNNKEIKK